jgi:thiamine-monophosphate kinase
MPLKHLGYKAVTTNISDIYCDDHKATQITVSVTVQSFFHWSIDRLFAGFEMLQI